MAATVPPKFKNIGHRGAAGHAPENTLSSFRKALEMGADTLEMDVHLSKDGEIIVMHDPKVDRTTNGIGYIKDLTVSELKQLEANKNFPTYLGEKIPTLQDVFDLAKGKATFVIEIKNGPIFYPGIEERLVELIEKNNLVDDVIVIAFYHPSLKRIKELNPRIKTGILFVGTFIDPWVVAAQVGADALHPMFEYVTEEFVAEAHKRGFVVHPWTINDPAQLEQWHKFGVDGIASDYPDSLSGLLRALNKKIEWQESSVLPEKIPDQTTLATETLLFPDPGTETLLTHLHSRNGKHPLLKRGFIFDVDGVLCWGETIIPRAPEAIERLRQGGKQVIFISNNSTKSRADYISKFERLGIPVTENDLVLSTYATAQYVANASPNAKVYMVGAPGLRKELELAGLELLDDPFKAEYVVAGSAFDGTGKISEENSLRITGALRALYHAKAKFIATNPDRIFPAQEGVIPGTGAVIGALSYMVGRQPDVIIGKPATNIVEIALKRIGLQPQECAIVGDMDTDMLAGKRTGVATIYVRSGAMTEEMLAKLGITPDFRYDSVIDILKIQEET